jgi:hypothetical protein
MDGCDGGCGSGDGGHASGGGRGGRRRVFPDGRLFFLGAPVLEPHLNLPGGHLEFFGELLASGSVWLLVCEKDAFQNFELGGGGTLAGLDGIGDVCIKHFRVDLCWIHAGWNEGGDVRAVSRGGGVVGWVTKEHDKVREGRVRGEKEQDC